MERPKNLKRIKTKAMADKFISSQIADIKKQVGNNKVILALSGGVDSSVVAALLSRAIGKNLICIHVNHGLLRKGESEQVVKVFRNNFKAQLKYINAEKLFLQKLKNVSDPEKKRKIIGKVFIDIFAKEAKKIKNIKYLAQGTIYPDILESKGIKSHHNVGGLPKNLSFKLIEPVKFLYKDEVRNVGLSLGLPHNMVYRQPFPGPGLGVRCTGSITLDRLKALREADFIVRTEIEKLKKLPWQYFCVVPDIKSTGIKNGKRFMGWPCIIRAIDTIDAVSAKYHEIPYKTLYKIRDRIIKEVKGINRVLLDFSNKPVSTIEWE